MSLLFVAASGGAQFAANLVMSGLSKVLGYGAAVEEELHRKPADGGIFRGMDDVRMLYAPLVSPFASAALLAWVARALAVPATDGVKLSMALFAVGAAHGLLIDYTTYRISARTVAYFLLCTAVNAAINGSLLARMGK
jgi:hypothetical protein